MAEVAALEAPEILGMLGGPGGPGGAQGQGAQNMMSSMPSAEQVKGYVQAAKPLIRPGVALVGGTIGMIIAVLIIIIAVFFNVFNKGNTEADTGLVVGGVLVVASIGLIGYGIHGRHKEKKE